MSAQLSARRPEIQAEPAGSSDESQDGSQNDARASHASADGLGPPGAGDEPKPSLSRIEQPRSRAVQVGQDYPDPFAEWSSRDILLSLVPFIVVYAFKDSALNAALAFAIVWSAGLLILRLISFDGRHKLVWPVLDITSLILFAILRGFTRRWYYWIHKWVPVIVPLTFALVAIGSLLWRRPFTAHYARFPKFDRGGKGLWHGDASFRRTAACTTVAWAAAWCVMLLLSMIPVLTSFSGLNALFNYIVPFLLLVVSLQGYVWLGCAVQDHAEAPDLTDCHCCCGLCCGHLAFSLVTWAARVHRRV